jgi:hypothetical protein
MSNHPGLRKRLISLIKAAASRGIASGYAGFHERRAEEKEPWRIKRSTIHGNGLFATSDIQAGDHLGRSANLEEDEAGLPRWDITEASRYTNHSPDPNAETVIAGNIMSMQAVRPIARGEEIKVSYAQVSAGISPGTRLTYKGKPVPQISETDLSKWAMDTGKHGRSSDY